MGDCFFCKIAVGNIPAYTVWENADHLAFLTIFPNTAGTTVVIPKKHYPSYVASVPDEAAAALLDAARMVCRKLDAAFEDAGRTAIVFEGLGVNHAHAKLYPLHGTRTGAWKQNEAHLDHVFSQYEGYLSTHEGPRADEEELAQLAEKIRAA